MTPLTARTAARPRPVRQPVLPRHRAPAPPPCFGEARFRGHRPEPEGYDGPVCCINTVCQCHDTTGRQFLVTTTYYMGSR